MRFLIDAQLPPRLTELFREAGHEAVHVDELGLLTAGDGQIRTVAAKRGMVIVTKDEDFVVMRRLSERAPAVIWIRTGNATNRVLTARLRPVLKEICDALAKGEAIVEVR